MPSSRLDLPGDIPGSRRKPSDMEMTMMRGSAAARDTMTPGTAKAATARLPKGS